MTAKRTTPPPAEPAIDSVEALTEAYPDLIEQVFEEVAARARVAIRDELEAMGPEAFRQTFPKMAAKLTEPAPSGLDSKKGFILAIGDPFAAGTERVYARLYGRPPRSLPCLLPFKDPATAETLASYRVRAAGAGDRVRTANVDLALEHCKK